MSGLCSYVRICRGKRIVSLGLLSFGGDGGGSVEKREVEVVR